MLIGYFPEIDLIAIRENNPEDGIEILYRNSREDFERDLDLALIGQYTKAT